MVPPRPSRSAVTWPEASSTASAPSPGSVEAPKMGVNWISSLSSVQVKSCLGGLCRRVVLAAAAPDQTRLAVLAVHDALRAIGGRGVDGVRERGHVHSFAVPFGEDEARAAVHGLADQVAFENGDAYEVARRAVGSTDYEVPAVYGSQSVGAGGDRGQKFPLRHDLRCQLRLQRAVVAIGIYPQDVHDPRPRCPSTILASVDGADACIILSGKFGAQRVGPGLCGEGAHANEVAQWPTLRVVGGAVLYLHRSRGHSHRPPAGRRPTWRKRGRP